jgi:hypothetical protein
VPQNRENEPGREYAVLGRLLVSAMRFVVWVHRYERLLPFAPVSRCFLVDGRIRVH